MSCKCGCSGSVARVHLKANFSGAVRRETFKGREHLVVPVVMLRQTVVNGAYVPKDQLKPEAWNGVPVTVNHPMERGQTVTANSPKVLEQWQVGTIFNAKIKEDRLVAEAWVDVELAEANLPGLVDRLEAGEPMDVSTGYFPTTQRKKGVYNGKNYTEVHTELKPDHLALLPDDTGACSWEDGCGVRANKKGDQMPKEDDEKKGLLALFSKLIGNARGSDNDRRQIIADLLSDDRAPFVPDDMYSLMEMSQETLEALRKQYLGDSTPATNQEGDAAVSDPNKKPETAAAPVTQAQKVSEMTVAELTTLMTNTAKTAATEAVKEQLTANKTADLVAKLAANKDLGFTEEELKAMPLSALEKLAANAEKAKPAVQRQQGPVNFGGRALRTNADEGATEKKFPGMVTNHAASTEVSKEKKEA